MFLDNRKKILWSYLLIALVSTFFLTQLKFSFSFEQFFPKGDKELEYFEKFIEEFETDDNFLMIAVENQPSVFDSNFIKQFHQFTLVCNDLPKVKSVTSLTTFGFPVKTPFGINTIPALHMKDFDRLASDSTKIFEDARLSEYLITKDASAMNVIIKTDDYLGIDDSKALMKAVDQLLEEFQFENNHILGRAYFMDELSRMQFREVIVSAFVSIILVSIILVFLFRKPIGIFIALSSIGLGLLFFMGILGLWGRELNAMAAFYPVLMLIVGTSDVVHIMSKYVDELKLGATRENAIMVTIKEIGMATLLTSLTTSAGFLSLLTSKIQPLRDFGVNSALGVMIAYLTVITFTTALLSLFPRERLIKEGKQQLFWDRLMTNSYWWNRRNPIKVLIGAGIFAVFCGYGISLITTNYKIISNMPRGEKITSDFLYFEKELGGFRPMEFAIFLKDTTKSLYDPVVVQSIDGLEKEILATGKVKNSFSITSLYKSIHQMMNRNQASYYKLPEEKDYPKYNRYISKLPKSTSNVLVSRDQKKTRISAKIKDMGADSVKVLSQKIEAYIDEHIDSNLLEIRQTGTGVIIDKNAEYLRRNLIEGLGLALIIVSILMMFLFKDIKFWLISLIPNLLPLLFAASVLGYLGIELEATISIIFALVFGIAVDDTIHFLSKYKLAFDKLKDKEEALKITFQETGKAIVFTSIILFFGFLVMLFSVHPPSVTIGLLISITLVSALVADMMLIPWLIRKLT